MTILLLLSKQNWPKNKFSFDKLKGASLKAYTFFYNQKIDDASFTPVF